MHTLFVGVQMETGAVILSDIIVFVCLNVEQRLTQTWRRPISETLSQVSVSLCTVAVLLEISLENQPWFWKAS